MKDTVPLGSKKFLAYVISEATWKITLIVALGVFKEDLQAVGAWAWWFLMSIVVTAGFVVPTAVPSTVTKLTEAWPSEPLVRINWR